MSKKTKILAAIIIILLGSIIYLETSQKKELNWAPSYNNESNLPLATKVLFKSLKKTLKPGTIKEVNKPPFEFLKDSSDTINGTYFFVNEYVSFDEDEAHKILNWVRKGNTLFIAGKGIGKTILDTLNLKTEAYSELSNFEHKPLLQLTNPAFQTHKPYELDLEVYTLHFNKVDSLNTISLGTFELSKKENTEKNNKLIHFVKQRFGDGEIVIHLMPQVFTNYFLLKEDQLAYTQSVLSYLNTNTTDHLYWDNYVKNDKSAPATPLYILLNNERLKWAYYIVLLGTIMWVYFKGKRKQRAIPVIEPLPNQTLAFTKTIAGMYLDKKDHKSIATHLINHFFDYMRSHHQMKTDKINTDFITRAASKTGNTIEDTKRLLDYIMYIQQNKSIRQEQLITLNKKIENFKAQNHGH